MTLYSGDAVRHRAKLCKNVHKVQEREAAFLYLQRARHLKDSSLGWQQMDREESLFEPYIDELFHGGNLAREALFEAAEDKRAEHIHVALCVLSRQEHLGDIKTLLEPLDLSDASIAAAVADAFKTQLPGSCLDPFLLQMLNDRPESLSIVTRVAAHRRWDISGTITRAAFDTKPAPRELAIILRCLGRLGSENARYLYLDGIESGNDDVCFEAALAMLRSQLNIDRVREQCLEELDSRKWPLYILGLCGHRGHAPLLMERSAAPPFRNHCFFALGLLGDPRAVEFLIRRVDHPELGPHAAIAANLIIGAEIRAELEKKSAELCLDPMAWEKWWAVHRNAYEERCRYRNGRPCSPKELITNLSSPYGSRRLRQMASEELAVRYGLDDPFETDDPVSGQLAAIERFKIRLKSIGASFKPGGWYLSGKPDYFGDQK